VVHSERVTWLLWAGLGGVEVNFR